MTPSGAAELGTKPLWAVFAAALLVRLVNVATIAIEPEVALIEDATLYWHGARDWIDSGGFSRLSALENGTPAYAPEHERVPGYFLFLVPLRALFGENHIPVLVAQSLLDSLTCVLIALLGCRVSRETGLAAGLLAAIWPNLVIHSGLVLTETLFLFLTVLLMLAALRFADRLRWRDAWLTGLLCGAAIMVRPVMQFMPLALMAGAAALPLLRGGWRRTALAAPILLALGVAIPVAPYLLRNHIVFDEPRLTSQTGTHMLFWIASQVEQVERGGAFDEITDAYHARLERRLAARGATLETAPPFVQDRAMQQLAREILAEHPVGTIARAWLQGMTVNLLAPAILIDPRIRTLKTDSFMTTAPGDVFTRARQTLATVPPAYLVALAVGGVGSATSLILAAIGLFVLLRRDWPLAILGLAVIGYFLAVTGPVASPKYRLPIEPVLIVACAAALAAGFEWWRRKRLTASLRANVGHSDPAQAAPNTR